MNDYRPMLRMTDAEQDPMLSEILDGLSAPQKTLPSALLYDERGSDLFEDITRLPEYYPTRTEICIFRDNLQKLFSLAGPKPVVVEFGSGSSRKTPLLLSALEHPREYIPLDISEDFMLTAAADIRRRYPGIRVTPITLDFTKNFSEHLHIRNDYPVVGFFPGSTIGNFHPQDAMHFLNEAKTALGPGAILILGVDLQKDIRILERAYNDSAGVTAAFNRNIVRHLNQRYGATFDYDAFSHRAVYNRDLHRIEMHLVTGYAHQTGICGRCFKFAEGETIHTENSYKYTIESFQKLARNCGWLPHDVWTDADRLFSVHVLTQPS